MRKSILVILFLMVSTVFVRAEEIPAENKNNTTMPNNSWSFQESMVYDPTISVSVDVGTSVGIGFNNYKKNKRDVMGYSFGINRSFLEGNAGHCWLGISFGSRVFCYTGLDDVKFSASNDFFVNIGAQSKNKDEIGILLGRDLYKSNPSTFKNENAIAFGLYYKRYFANNIGIKIGFLVSSINRVETVATNESYELRANSGEEDELSYKRLDFTIGYRF
jgi:hypothetical protein